MKKMIYVIFILLASACGSKSKKASSIEFITMAGQQDSVFQSLVAVTNNAVPDSIQNDSLAFLILPVQASCPSCRNKTIDSIVKHRKNLADRHFIIISADGGRKTIAGYFTENDKRLPVIKNRLFLDSTNEADKHELYDKKPTIYYTYNRKAYKKVAAIPATVREDLREFFSGHRNDEP